MHEITVCVAIIDKEQVLLTKRDDFEVWCLPSGGMENGESVAQAAIRETKEETGLDVELKSLVGIYSRIGELSGTHSILFSATPNGGTIQIQPGETIDVRFFSIDNLPVDMLIGHRTYIEDAISGNGGSLVVTRELILPPGQKINRKEIIAAQKLPRESRLEFYQKKLKQATNRDSIDVGEK
ncbi:MAG: NUDIX domain-containing protein [Candidatus Kariarchaeaceae archaeon]|jgi:ADP-ribose pyrophosphatase YjhB (NUDIX family)